MLEIEVNLIGLDEEAFLDQLLKKGARFDVQEEQTNIRIDSSAHPIPEDAYLRLRKIQTQGKKDQLELTYKKSLEAEGARTNEETTSLVEDGEAILKILACLGFDQRISAQKRRIRYQYQDYRVEFDRWDPKTLSYPYVEVEAKSLEALNRFLKEFSIPEEKVSTKSIADLIREEQAKKES